MSQSLPEQNGIIKPGVYTGIPSEAYHTAPGISSTQVKYLAKKTPTHWYAKYVSKEIEDKYSDSMSLGTVFHALVLEPETVDELFRPALNPEDFPDALKGKQAIVNRLKEINQDIQEKKDRLSVTGTIPELTKRLLSLDKEAVIWDRLIEEAAKDPREPIPLDMWDAARRMRDNTLNHATAAQLLTGGIAESSIFAVHPELDLPLKVRPDYANPREQVMVDLKSTRSADPWLWGKDAGNLGYHIQQAMYLNVPALLPSPQHYEDFVFVLTENTAPYICECAVLEKATALKGWERYRDNIERLSECITSGRWPGYSAEDEIITVEAPSWAA